MTETPRYLRFARSLALTTGLAAISGCGASPFPRTTDAGTEPDAGIVADAGTLTCNDCQCSGRGGDVAVDAGVVDCYSIPELVNCCATVGPLPPPDLAV